MIDTVCKWVGEKNTLLVISIRMRQSGNWYRRNVWRVMTFTFPRFDLLVLPFWFMGFDSNELRRRNDLIVYLSIEWTKSIETDFFRKKRSEIAEFINYKLIKIMIWTKFDRLLKIQCFDLFIVIQLICDISIILCFCISCIDS